MSNPKGKPRSIFKSLSGFNRVLLLFGLGIPPDVATGSIKVNLRNRIGFLVSLSWAVFAMGIALSEPVFEIGGRVDLVISGWHYQYQLQVTLVLPLMLFNYIKRGHVQMFVAKVHEFDDTLAQMKWIRVKPPRSCRQIELGLFVSSISLLLLFFLILAVANEMRPLALARSMVHIAVTEFYLLTSFQFIFGTLSIYRRFSWLNTNVR